jgi:hypothetical protein
MRTQQAHNLPVSLPVSETERYYSTIPSTHNSIRKSRRLSIRSFSANKIQVVHNTITHLSKNKKSGELVIEGCFIPSSPTPRFKAEVVFYLAKAELIKPTKQPGSEAVTVAIRNPETGQAKTFRGPAVGAGAGIREAGLLHHSHRFTRVRAVRIRKTARFWRP